MPKFTVEILSEKAFERMAKFEPRYTHVLDEDDPSLAFADKQKGRVFIRNTHWPEANRLLLHHELDHLVEEHGTDEDEHGIRHKKFFKQMLLPIIAPELSPFVNEGFNSKALKQSLNIGASGLGGFATGGPIGAVGAGTVKSLQLAAHPGQKSPITFGNTFGSGLQGAGIGGLANLGGATLGAPSGFTSGPFSLFGQGQPSSALSKGVSPAQPGTALSGNQQGAGGNIFSRFKNFFGGGPPTPPPGGQAASDLLERSIASGNFGGGKFNLNSLQELLPQFGTQSGVGGGVNWGQTGLGAALSLGGQAFAPKPKAPDFGSLPDVQRLRQTLGQPQSPLGALGTQRLTERLGQTYQGLPPEVEANVRRQFDRERQDLMSQFKQFQPGADLATNSRLRQAMDDISAREAQTIGSLGLGERGRFESRQGQDIAAALGVDTQTLEVLMQLANADISTIMVKFGMDAQAAQNFKDTFSNLGQLIAAKGLGLNQFAISGIGVP